MTKTLTEQWREGTLPEDCYYILTKNGHIRKERTCFYSRTDEQCFCFTSNKDIQEVLAPVPSYDEWQAELDSNDELLNVQKRLEKRNEIATKALKKLTRNCNKWEIARKALKEMEGVK